MRHFLLTTLLAASPALAEDFRIAAPVTEATVFADGALVVRRETIEMPKGLHRILLPASRNGGTAPRLSGAQLGALSVVADGLGNPEDHFTDTQSTARAAKRSAEDTLRSAEANLANARAEIEGLEAEIAFLASVRGGALEQFDPDATIATAKAIWDETRAAHQALVAARSGLPDLERAVAEARVALSAAERAFQRSAPPQQNSGLLIAEVQVAQAGPVTLTLTEPAAANWQPTYVARLDSDAGEVRLERRARVNLFEGSLWQDVALTLSTAQLSRGLQASPVSPDRAVLFDPEEVQSRVRTQTFAKGGMAAARMEADVAAESVLSAAPALEGPVVTYSYPAPVTLTPQGGSVSLSLGEDRLAPDLYNRAAPKFDQTAFLTARLVNTTGAPLLPGELRAYRDGAFMGDGYQPMVAAGETFEMGFGAQQHLRVSRTLLANNTGDRGLVTSSSTRVQAMEFEVQNLGDTTEEIEVFYALPFAEEEDLRLRIDARPAPVEQDVDKARGVAKWVLDVPPGQSEIVALSFDFRWPEGQQMVWRP